MIDSLLAERRSIAANYQSLLSELPVVSPMESGTLHSWQSYVIRLDDYRRRDVLISYCRSVGIELGQGTISMPFTEYFQQKYGDLRSQLPVLARTEKSLVSLPLFAGISLQQQELVVSHLKRVLM
jgi:dTDP-4-amino-4,6-dideoxygalactose transaminase